MAFGAPPGPLGSDLGRFGRSRKNCSKNEMCGEPKIFHFGTRLASKNRLRIDPWLTKCLPGSDVSSVLSANVRFLIFGLDFHLISANT